MSSIPPPSLFLIIFTCVSPCPPHHLLLLLPRRTRCRHYGSSKCSNPESGVSSADQSKYSLGELEAGTWHVYHMEDAHHHSIVPMWTGSDRQITFWKDLGKWLAGVDSLASSRPSIEFVKSPSLDAVEEDEVAKELLAPSSNSLAGIIAVVPTNTRNDKAKQGHRRLGSFTSEFFPSLHSSSF